MTKAQVIKFILALVAAAVPVIVATFPGLPPVLVAILSALAAFKGGDMLHKMAPPSP